MPQITIYLEEEVSTLVRAAAKEAGVSRSRWIADAIRSRVRSEWPASVRAMAGAWPDFPSAEEIRSIQGPDAPRGPL